MPSVPQPSPPVESLELPELDKSDESDEVDVGTFELDMNVGDDGDDGLPADTFEVDIQLLTDAGSNEAAEDLDIGGSGLLPALAEEDPTARDDEHVEHGAEELDLHLDSPLESDEPSSHAELGDDGLEQLPELVSEDGDGDEGPAAEGSYLPSAPEGTIGRGPSYESEWLLLGTPCSALWAGQRAVLAAADDLKRFGVERRSQTLPAGLRVSSLLLLEDDSVMLATTRGLLCLAPSGTSSLESDPGRVNGSQIVELASARGGDPLWARLSNGALLRLRDGSWERHEAGGTVRALTSDQQSVTLLVEAHRPTLQLSSDGGSSFREILLPEPAATVARGVAPTAVSRAELIALADPERGLCLSNDGGATFRMVIGAVNVTSVTLGDHAGRPALFAAVHREGKDLTELLLVDAESAAPLCIAELSGEPEEEAEETGRTQALVFADGALWAAGGYGLVRLRAPRSQG